MKITRRQLRDIIREAIDQDEWREFYKPSYENVPGGGGEALSKRLRGDDNPYTLGDESSGITADETLAAAIDDKLEDKYGPETTAVSLEDWKQMIVDNLKNSDTNIDEIEDLPGDYDYDNLWRNDADAADVARDIYADHASNIHDTYSDR